MPEHLTQYTSYESVRKRGKCSVKTVCNMESRQNFKPHNLGKKIPKR